MTAPLPGPSPTTSSRDGRDGVETFRRMVWWSTVGMVYAVGAFVVTAVVLSGTPPTVMVVLVAGAAAGTWSSAQLMERRLNGMPGLNPGETFAAPTALVVAAVLGAVCVVAAAAVGAASGTWSLVPGMAIGAIAVWMPRRRRVWLVVTSALVALAAAALLRSLGGSGQVWPQDITNAVLMAFIAAAIVVSMWSWDVVLRLDRARRLEAELAVADERLRFAADLHDVQGHHLQVIALESELATRLAGTDPERARAHMQQVHDQAQSALGETRDLVRGYRRTTLGEELSNATRVMAAAGIDGRLAPGTEAVADRLPEVVRHLLGLVVREATTNVLRHSRAGTSRIALELEDGSARLRMSNDGVTGSPGEAGSGLGTLAERIGAVGGALRWERDGEWFIVDAHLPVAAAP